MIELGVMARDKITNFTGVVTGRSQFLTGCDQYLLQPNVGEGGEYRDGKWFDEGRLSVQPAKPVDPADVQGERPGGPDRGAPVK